MGDAAIASEGEVVMRLLIVGSLVAVSSFAHAGGSSYTPLVDIREVDAGCRGLAVIPANATTPGPSLDAAISTASCLAELHARRLVLAPTLDSVRALDDAVAPAVRIFDRVIATGDAPHALAALYAKADLFDGNADRIMDAVPHLSPQISRAEVAEHEARVRAAADLTAPWRRRAATSRRAIAKLVLVHPELATTRDVVLGYELANSHIVAASGLAR